MPKLRRQLTQKQSTKLKRVFDAHDEGGKGLLTFSEFQALMRSLGQEMPLKRCEEMVRDHARKHHEDHFGEVGFVEEDLEHISFELFCFVVKGAARQSSSNSVERQGSISKFDNSAASAAVDENTAKLRRVFDAHDVGSKNCLTFSEFQTLMRSLGREIPMDELLDMIKNHAREHHRIHFGEDNFVEEDLQHISFDLFCFVVQRAQTRRNSKRFAADTAEDAYDTFLASNWPQGWPVQAFLTLPGAVLKQSRMSSETKTALGPNHGLRIRRTT